MLELNNNNNPNEVKLFAYNLDISPAISQEAL